MGKENLLLDSVLREIHQASNPMLSRVLDYIRLLKAKEEKEGWDFAIASESSLEKDWLKPEEDEAWKDL